MPTQQKPTDSSKRPFQKQNTKKKATVLTPDDTLAFDAVTSPPPKSTTNSNFLSRGTDDSDFDEGEQQDKDKQQKTNKHSTPLPVLKALKTTNNDHVIPSSYKTTTVKEMMKDNPTQMRRVVYLRLLRILTKQPTANAVYSMGEKQKQQKSNLGPHRLSLFMDVMDPQGQTVYIISNSTAQNKNLWTKTRGIRDDGTITIGTIVGIMAPHPITQRYNNDIPVVFCDGGLVVVQDPGTLDEIKLNNDLPEKMTMGFYTKGKIELMNASVIPSKCNGYFCDRQRIHDLDNQQAGCACFQSGGRLSNIVISCNLKIKIQHNEESPIIATQFCSHRFTNVFLKKPFPGDVYWSHFDQNTAFEILLDSIIATIKVINENGGWTVIGWSKRGEINDVAFKQSDTAEKVTSSEINHHITSIVPANDLSINELYLESLWDVSMLSD